MPDIVEASVRYRVSITRNTKGYTFDCTTETVGMSMEDALVRSDALVAQLEKRYPAQV